MRSLLPCALLLATAALTTPAHAGEPCDHLRGKKLKSYNSLGKEAAEYYKADNFVGAVDTILQLKEICDEDPRLDFNLARAYQNAGNCNMARYWFETVLAHADRGSLSKEQPNIALEALAKLETQCAGSTRVTIACSDPNVSLSLKGPSEVTSTCPFSGRVDAGTYTLTASAEGLTPNIVEVGIEPEVHNRVNVSPLYPETDGYGRLSVPCTSGSRGAFTLVSPDGTERQESCPAELRLPPGDYVVRFPNAYESAVSLRPNEARTLQADKVILDPGFGREGWGWLSVGMGTTILVTSIGLHILANDMLFDVLEPNEVAADGTVLSLSQRTAQDIEDRANTINTVALVGDILGGAALVTGIVLLVLPEDEVQPETEDEDGLSLQPVYVPGGALFQLSGRF